MCKFVYFGVPARGYLAHNVKANGKNKERVQSTDTKAVSTVQCAIPLQCIDIEFYFGIEYIRSRWLVDWLICFLPLATLCATICQVHVAVLCLRQHISKVFRRKRLHSRRFQWKWSSERPRRSSEWASEMKFGLCPTDRPTDQSTRGKCYDTILYAPI